MSDAFRRKLTVGLVIVCLLVSTAGTTSLGWMRPVFADATCTNTQPLTLGSEIGRVINGTICFAMNLTASASVLSVALLSVSGNYDLYVAKGSLSRLTDYAYKMNLSLITPSSPATAFILQRPTPGNYTVAIQPRVAGSVQFRMKTGTGQSQSSTPSQAVCNGGVCTSSHPLTVLRDAVIGSQYGARAVFPIDVPCPGLIRARATWTGTAQRLALILNGPGQVGYYDRSDGQSPREVSYNVTAADVRKGLRWWVTLTNFWGGEAAGNLLIDYPDASQCPAAQFDEVRDLAVQWSTDKEVTFNFNYTYASNHGDSVYAGVYAIKDGRPSTLFGYGPSRLQRGQGRASVRLAYVATQPGSQVTTNQVEIVFYEGGRPVFFTQRFNFNKTWRIAGQALPPPEYENLVLPASSGACRAGFVFMSQPSHPEWMFCAQDYMRWSLGNVRYAHYRQGDNVAIQAGWNVDDIAGIWFVVDRSTAADPGSRPGCRALNDGSGVIFRPVTGEGNTTFNVNQLGKGEWKVRLRVQINTSHYTPHNGNDKPDFNLKYLCIH